MNKNILIGAAVLFIGAQFLTSCGKDEPTPTSETNTTPTLYDRVGGVTLVADPANPGDSIQAGRLKLRSVVDSAIFVIAGDTTLAKFFPVLLAEVNSNPSNLTGFNALSQNFTDFLCLATKQPGAAYSGMNMTDAHNPAKNSRMGTKATNADFTQFVKDIVIALGQNGVTDAVLLSDLGALLETTRIQIVQQ